MDAGSHADSMDLLDQVYFTDPVTMQAPPRLDGEPATINLVMLLRLLCQRYVSRKELKRILGWARPSLRLSTQQVAELTALYDRIDGDGDGTVTLQELREQAAENYRELLTQEELDKMLNEMFVTISNKTTDTVSLNDYIRFYRQLWHTMPTSFVPSVVAPYQYEG